MGKAAPDRVRFAVFTRRRRSSHTFVRLPLDALAEPRRRRGGGSLQYSGTDRIVLALMVIVPTTLVVGLVWLPAIASVVLSFANWTGVGGLDTIKWVGVS